MAVISSTSKISVQSLQPADYEGFLTKRGADVQSWKRRWFILKDDVLVYLKSCSDKEPIGIIRLDARTIVRDERTMGRDEKHKTKNREYMFSITTPSRVYYIHSGTESDSSHWISAISNNVSKLKSRHCPKKEICNVEPSPPPPLPPPPPVRSKINCDTFATMTYRFLPKIQHMLDQNENDKVFERWRTWAESFLSLEEGILSESAFRIHVSISTAKHATTWAIAGTINSAIVVQEVLYFLNGLVDLEIESLSNLCRYLLPNSIGCLINMSGKGGMDVGCYFPCRLKLSSAVALAKIGHVSRRVLEWAEENRIDMCNQAAQYMGYKPEQTQIIVPLPGKSYEEQLKVALDAFQKFEFPAISEEMQGVLSCAEPDSKNPICLSICLRHAGFSSLGILIPNPAMDFVEDLCHAVSYNKDRDVKKAAATAQRQMREMRNQGSGPTLGPSPSLDLGPSFAELLYLAPGFGYRVYNVGFDVVMHYDMMS